MLNKFPLKIELVPKTCWYSNVRSNVSQARWDQLRKWCYKKAGYKCEICGGVGDAHPVECHEIWHYDDENLIQKLTGLIALCPNCHKCKHPGLAKINGQFDSIVIPHLMRINNINKTVAYSLVERAFTEYYQRSAFEWELDISYIN